MLDWYVRLYWYVGSPFPGVYSLSDHGKSALILVYWFYRVLNKSSCLIPPGNVIFTPGITIETRPDYCLKKHLSAMLSYGCTRLEIGVQSVYEDVARDTNRGQLTN